MSSQQNHNEVELSWWDEWRELKRHTSKVTLWDLVLYQIYLGELPQLKRNELRYILFSKRHIRSLGGAVLLLNKIRKLKRNIKFRLSHISYVTAEFTKPTKLTGIGKNKRIDTTSHPYINFYAYWVDYFAHEYSWTENMVREIPYTSMFEFYLAAENRHAFQHTKMSAAANPTKEGLKSLGRAPRRDVKVPASRYFEDQRAKDPTSRGRRNARKQ